MHHEKVSSDHISSVAHDPINRVLEVKFNNGAVYQYRGVPAETHKQMMACPSTGQFLHHEIKPNFDCTRVK